MECTVDKSAHVTVLGYIFLLVEAFNNKVCMGQEQGSIAVCCTLLLHLQSALDSSAISIRSNCLTAVWQIVWHALNNANQQAMTQQSPEG